MRCHHVRIIVAIACVLLFVVCNSFAAPVTIEFLLKGSDRDQTIYKHLAEMFNSTQDEVRVTITPHANNPVTYTQTLLVRTAAGSAPDVINANWLGSIGANNLAMPLESFLEKDGIRKFFVPMALEQSSYEGALIQLPLFIQPLMTFYNEQLFAEAGLLSPKALYAASKWDWDQVVEATRRISKDTDGNGVKDIWGFGANGATLTRAVLWVRQAGGYFFDTFINPKESRMNTPEILTALEFQIAFIKELGLPVEALATSQPGTMFATQKVGMIFEGPWSIGGNRVWKEWNLAPVPHGPANAETAVQVDGLQISSGSKNPEAAWKWLHFLATDPEAMAYLAQQTGRPPAVLNLLPRYEQLVRIDGHPDTSVVVSSLMQPNLFPLMAVTPHWSTLESTYGKEMGKFFRGEQSAMETMLRTHEQFTNILSGNY